MNHDSQMEQQISPIGEDTGYKYYKASDISEKNKFTNNRNSGETAEEFLSQLKDMSSSYTKK